MKYKTGLFAILCLSSSITLAETNTSLNESEIKDLIRQKFIISSYDTYYPNQYGAYLIPKDEMFKGPCKNKKYENSLYLVDHEGGQVRRIPSKTLSAKDSMNISFQSYSKMWKEDLNWIQMNCLNVTLGPTVDESLSSRSYTSELKMNFKMVEQLLTTYKPFNIKYTIKHFPGAYEKCDQPNRKKEQQICDLNLNEIDSGWGKYLRNNPPPSLMVSHNYYKTTEQLPAFMNQEILKYLREDVKYEGVLMTDALWELDKPVSTRDLVMMFKYNDLIMMLSHDKIEQSVDVLYKMSKDFPILLDYAKESKARINKWKEIKN